MSIETFRANIRAGLRQRLMLVAGLPAVAWEARDYKPTIGTPYIAEALQTVSNAVTALGRGGNIAHTLLQTYNLFFPINAGTNPSDTLAGTLVKHFAPGTGIAYGGDTAMVQQAEQLSTFKDGEWLNTPITITLVGHTQNL
jgi:hypothetical protein